MSCHGHRERPQNIGVQAASLKQEFSASRERPDTVKLGWPGGHDFVGVSSQSAWVLIPKISSGEPHDHTARYWSAQQTNHCDWKLELGVALQLIREVEISAKAKGPARQWNVIQVVIPGLMP